MYKLTPLRRRRLERGLTQFELALGSGVHQPRISLFENKLALPTQDEARRLARVLKVRIGDIFPDLKEDGGRDGQ